MTITPVVPKHQDQYIDTSQGIIIDYTTAPKTVDVKVGTGAAVRVWDDISGFQNSWTGNYINDGTYIRLVCDAPADYTVGDMVEVTTTTSTESLTYDFRVALERLTTTEDTIRPQVVKVSTYVWSGRVHNNESSWPVNFDGPGNIYLHVLEPRASEVIVVPGNDVGLVYDETRGKVIVYFNRHGTIYYMEADPADVPDTKNHLRSLRETINFGVYGSGNPDVGTTEGGWSTVTYPPIQQVVLEALLFSVYGAGEGIESTLYQSTTYPPLQKVVLEDNAYSVYGAGGTETYINSPYNAANTPNLATGILSDTTTKIRVARPTATLEDGLFIGYYLIRFEYGTPTLVSYLDFGTNTFIEFEDTAQKAGIWYAVVPKYWRNQDRQETVVSIASTQIYVYPNSVAQQLVYAVYGEGSIVSWTDSSFPVIGP